MSLPAGCVVLVMFLAIAYAIGVPLFFKKKNNRNLYQRGRDYALYLYKTDSRSADREIEEKTEEARDFRTFNNFDQGMLDVRAEREVCRLETYKEAKERGVKFASQIVRNYPEAGVQTLVEAQLRHASTQVEFDAAFSDGIQEVLDQLAGMGK